MADEQGNAMVVGFTTAELNLILTTLRWHAEGMPAPDSGNFPVAPPDMLAKHEVQQIEEQLVEGWDAENVDGFMTEAVHPVMFMMGGEVRRSRWLDFILRNVYDHEVTE